MESNSYNYRNKYACTHAMEQGQTNWAKTTSQTKRNLGYGPTAC